MNFFRRINRQTLLGWSLLLSVVFLSAQGFGLHLHPDHGADHQSSVHVEGGADVHTHASQVHSALDTSHGDHHDSAVSVIDINPDGVLKNFNHIFPIALVVFLFTLVVIAISRRVPHREEKRPLHQHHLIAPPLRAPPQF